MGKKALMAAAILSAIATPAIAGTLDISVTDQMGMPAANAVVELVPDASREAGPSHVPMKAVIDQRHETFIPLVSLIAKGGDIVFTNNDTTMHEVYSFSAIKQFEFEIDEGRHSEPVVFDKPGVAAIGCNIHDQMITYVYVAASPFAAITDASGHAVFSGLPQGQYHAQIWHPQLWPGDHAPSHPLTVDAQSQSQTFALNLMPPPAKRPMHMGGY